MERKLVQQGNSTLMVSLPYEWVKKNSLRKGAEVSIREDDNNMVIFTKSEPSKKKAATLTLTTDTEPSVRTAIISAYRSGYDLIRINFKCRPAHQLVAEIIKNYTIGLEIIEQGKNFLLLENITEPDAGQFEVLFNKIFYNISLLAEHTEQRLKGKETLDCKSIIFKIHQYDNFCRRVVSKKPFSSTKAGFYYALFTLITQGQRELYHLNSYLDENKVMLKDFRVLEHLKEVLNLLREAHASKNLALIEQIHDLKKEFRHTVFYPSIEKGRKKENVALYHIASSLRLFYLACSPVTGLVIGFKESS